ncbi:hypothetical protein [Tenacibaculum sp. M341]|uniref:hypothetical protein n=1 Tax=Tenacibaculum sp. M341 TaxID=2530339 RepID=UPI00104EDBE3|nr:hypothetical protein [Tenacibaculum sp. M341]TCI93073.1 hypothetical protein EYW44_05495 [Tenacibaculum sp. M341]
MTVQDLINQLSSNSSTILNYYIALLVLALMGMLIVTPKNFKAPINYFYTALVYAVAIPGILAIILLVYNFFYLRANLMQLEVLTYYLPIIAMLVLFVIINKTIPLKRIPGFDKISGLFAIIVVTFLITYLIQKIFIGIFFIGSITQLLVIFIVLLVIVKIGWDKVIK